MKGLGVYIGGKAKIARWIFNHFPDQEHYKTFIDVFGGLGNILLRKKHIGLEIYNDKWDDIVNFFKQLRDNSDELTTWLKSYPYARTVHDEFCEKYKNRNFDNDIERAGIVYYLIQNSISAVAGNTFKSAKTRDDPLRFNAAINRLPEIADRLRLVLIENRDFEDMFHSYDTDKTLWYVDPPYLDTEKYYHTEFTYRDHLRLADVLNNAKGLIVLSYYDDDELIELYPNELWYRHFLETKKQSAYTTSDRPLSREVLLLNYDYKQYHNKKKKKGISLINMF